jgi:hypothetical protein
VARPRWKLTIRSGSEVEHASFEALDEAIAAMRERAMSIRAQGPVEPASMLRDYTPGQQVQARLQLKGRGLLRAPIAGIDVRGDGTFVPFSGGVGRPEPARDALRPRTRDSAGSAAMNGAETEIPKGSYAAGERVKLPRGAEAPIAVFINGIEQSEGADYSLTNGEIVFTRPIVKEKVGTGRWLAMYLGLWGTYRKNETIDVQFVRDGKTQLVSDLDVIPYPETP